MRDRIWYNLQNSKFKCAYLTKVSNRAFIWGNAYSFFLAFTSASSVAAWTIWNNVPAIWGGIVALSQVLHIAKPYVPFFKHDRDFMEMAHIYDKLYLSYEKLWFKFEKEKIPENKAEKEFYSLRDKEMNMNNHFKHVYSPNFKGLVKQASEEVNSELSSTFMRESNA